MAEPDIRRTLVVLRSALVQGKPGVVVEVKKVAAPAGWLQRAVAEAVGLQIQLPLPEGVSLSVGSEIVQRRTASGWVTEWL